MYHDVKFKRTGPSLKQTQEVRRVALGTRLRSFAALCETVEQLFSFIGPYELLYVDDQKDAVTISSDEELAASLTARTFAHDETCIVFFVRPAKKTCDKTEVEQSALPLGAQLRVAMAARCDRELRARCARSAELAQRMTENVHRRAPWQRATDDHTRARDQGHPCTEGRAECVDAEVGQVGAAHLGVQCDGCTQCRRAPRLGSRKDCFLGRTPSPTSFSQPVSLSLSRRTHSCRSPIVGSRYKCSVREDYDLCAACERAAASDSRL